MKTEIVKVTPEIAAGWLALNTNNRPVATDRVNMYARDMKAGEWKLTHQGVAISVDHVIGDGQHRLLAVVKSGATVDMLVTTELPTESIIAIDRGFVRSISNSINMSVEDSKWITSRTTAAVKWAFIRRPSVSAAEIYEACVSIKPSLMFAANCMKEKVRGITRGPVVAAIALIHNAGCDAGVLSDFCNKLNTGVIEGEADTAIVRLRDWLLTNPSSIYSVSMEALYKTQRAFQLFESQTPCKRLVSPDVLPFNQLDFPANKEKQ